ncbi:MAG: methyltransferase domain-containing protein [Nitrososphaeria archaeon]|nr:methyltransferase domain-containing protein [Nitrososphaeria archaeon]
MHLSSLDLMRCVKCHSTLDLTTYIQDKEIEEGILTCTKCGLACPIIQGIAVLIDDFALYLSNRQKLGGELLLSAKSQRIKFMIKTALGKSTKNRDFSIIEKKWTTVYQKNQDSKFYDTIKKSLNFDSDLSLEHGCSIGTISKHLAKKSNNTFGIDKSFYAIVQAKKQAQKNLDFFVADSLEHPFGETKFDLIVGLNLFELIEPKHLLKLLSTQIQKNGTLVLSDPYDYERDVKSIKEPLYPDDVRKELTNLGFLISEKTKKPSNIQWSLNLHERAILQYLVDLIVAKKF